MKNCRKTSKGTFDPTVMQKAVLEVIDQENSIQGERS